MKCFCFCVVLISLCATNRAAAQCSLAPSAYSATCTNMESYISPFNDTLSSGWHGSKSSTAFGTELLAANSSISLKGITAPDALTKVEMELDDLSKTGVQFVTVAVGFPILYQPFYTSTNDPQGYQTDYQTVLTFYQNVVAQIRQRNMKVLVEAFLVFPQYATDLPTLSQYFSSLSTTEFAAARAQNATNVATLLKPDWLNLGSEPDTESEVIGLSAEYTPQQWATEISTMVSQLRSAGIKGSPLVGAGCGAWQLNGPTYDASTYVQALLTTGIDYFDMHLFTTQSLSAGVSYIDMAQTAGLGAAISEVWDHKLTDTQLQAQSEFAIVNALAAAEPYNDYSFWSPQDAEFLGQIIDLAHWKNLLYVSPFESELFVANLDYNQTSSLSGTDLMIAEVSAESAALSTGTLTPLGMWWSAAIKPVNATTISAAWNSVAAPVAAASMVSIYGSNLAAKSQGATTLPLPTTLAGITATLTDATGAQDPLPMFFAGPSQVNAYIPANANTGPGVITINTPSGPVNSPVDITPVSPTLFSADESGQGAAAGFFVTNENGAQTTVLIASGPLDLSAGQSALVLYGTGIENRTSLSDVTVTVGTQTLTAAYAGAASGFIGLDQVNVLLPASLAGSGTVNITVAVAGTASNTVTATFK